MRAIKTLRQPTVAAFGEWSETNIGDHAIHEGVRNFFGACDWRVRSFDLGALRPAAGTRPDAAGSPRDAEVRRRWSVPMLDAVPAAKRTVRGWRQRWLIQGLLPSLAACDAICVGGGALLMDDNLHFPQSLAALTWAARELDKPLLCLGCSAEGDWSGRGRRIVREFLARCGFVAVRDRASAERVADLLGHAVPIFGDFALPASTLSESDDPRSRRTPPRYLLAVNATHLLPPYDAHRQRYEHGLCEVIAHAVAQLPIATPAPARIAVFTTGTAQDLEPAARLCQRLAPFGAELHPGRSLHQVRELLRTSGGVVAARLHAAVIALAERSPVIGYSATPKIGNFFRSIGLDDCSFGPDDPSIAVVDRLRRLVRSGQPIPARTAAAEQRVQAAARKFLESLTLAIRYGEVARL